MSTSIATQTIRHQTVSIYIYKQNVAINREKGLRFPTIRGTLLPSLDWQFGGGLAVNWLWLRIRVCPSKPLFIISA